MLGLSKVMTVTCTYDHRVIQGAESGMFLGRLQALLEGQERFLRRDFRPSQSCRTSRCIGKRTVRFRSPGAPRAELRRSRQRSGRVLQLINAYRVRGHLIADFDPLGSEATYHAELDPATYGLTIWDLDREFLTGTLMSDADTSRKRSPRCARFSKHCARPIAEKSAAST